MWLLDVLTGQEYDCRLITAERNRAGKSLGGGCFQYFRDNHLQEDDKMLFDLGVPPTVLFVEVVCRNNLA